MSPFRRETYEKWLGTRDLTDAYRQDIVKKAAKFWSNRVYKNAVSCAEALHKHIQSRSLGKYDILGFRQVVRYLETRGLSRAYADKLRTYLKSTKSNPDMYVPSDEEVLESLRKLSVENRLLFTIYLASGIRKNEGQYLYENLKKLKTQKIGGFVKINLASFRKTKTAYFCYMPSWLHESLQQLAGQLSVKSLDHSAARHDTIAPKYARKWFYTKCIELGVPEAIADFYEGRISTSIGSNHYLAKQALADKYYEEVLLPFLDTFLRG